MSIVHKLSWLWRRLSIMTHGEIAYRMRAGFGDAVARVRERLQSSEQRILPEALLTAKFFQATEQQLFTPPCQRDPEDEQRLLAGEVPVFGEWVAVRQDPEFWHTDPLFQVNWAAVPYRDIDYRPGNPTGDVRVVWELNRLQHLFSLAVIANQDPGLRATAIGLLERDLRGWYAANPLGVGVNYISAMEEGLRIISLFHTFDLVRNWVSPGTRAIVAAIVVHHARHMQGRLSLYSSAGNHTIAEATGLLYAGLLLPESAEAFRWRETGIRILNGEAARQIDADGGGIEQATWYLLFITDLLGLAQALLAHAGEVAEPAIDAALSRSRGFLNALAASPKDLPRIGDADDGYALSPGLRISWLAAPAIPLRRSFRNAGLSVVRFDGSDRLLFLHNPLGMAPGFGHGHADCLSVLFRWGGSDLFIDPGTYLYGDSANYREYFRSARGHNTATINGADQAKQVGPFLWMRPYQVDLLIDRVESDCAWFLARHDAFKEQGVTHYRGVVYRQDCCLVVWDHFEGAVAHDVAVHWHLGCTPTWRDLTSGSVDLPLGHGHRVELEIIGGSITPIKGATTPLLGWRAPCYGSLESCTTLEVRANARSLRPIQTVLWLEQGARLRGFKSLIREFEQHPRV